MRKDVLVLRSAFARMLHTNWGGPAASLCCGKTDGRRTRGGIQECPLAALGRLPHNVSMT